AVQDHARPLYRDAASESLQRRKYPSNRHSHLCRPRFSAVVQVRQLSCGIGMLVDPRKPNASFTALEKHGTPPTFGLSPTPLAPIGWCGDGVVVQSVSHFGVSTAVGRKKSMKEAGVTLPRPS